MTHSFHLKDGTLFAQGYNRVVIGGQGPYIEFERDHIVAALETEPGQEYRGNGRYEHCKYFWLRPCGDSAVKVYHQRFVISYADYKPGMFYVDPAQLVWEGELYAERGERPGDATPTTWCNI